MPNASTNYQSSFSGKEIEQLLRTLNNWAHAGFSTANTDSNTTFDLDTVRIDEADYAVVWQVAPTSSNQVYGLGLHKTTGRIYEIYSNKGVRSAIALDSNSDTKNTAGSGNITTKLYLIGAASQVNSIEGTQTFSNIDVYTQNGGLYANSITGNTSLDVASTSGNINVTPNGNNNVNLFASNYSGTGKVYYKGAEIATIPGTTIEIVDLTVLENN